MAEPIVVDNGTLTDYSVLVDDVVDATLGTGAKQLVGLTDATIGSTTKVAAGGGVEAAALRVTVASDSTGVLSVDDNGGSLTVDGTVAVTGVATAANQTTVIGHLDGVEALLTTIDADTSNLSVVGSGTEAAAQRVTIATDSTGVLSVDDNGATLSVDDGGGVLTVDGTVAVTNAGITTIAGAVSGTEMQVDVLTIPALVAGSAAIGKLAANSGVDIGDVDVLSIAAGTNLIGGVNVRPATTGGLTIARDIDLDETELEIKATAGQLYGWFIYNDGAAEVYVKFYNATAANVTVGSTTPVMTVAIPAGSASNVEFTNGIAFGTAICAAATTGVADADTAAPAANQVVANFFFT